MNSDLSVSDFIMFNNKKKYYIFQSNLPDDENSKRELGFGDIFLNRLFHTKV